MNNRITYATAQLSIKDNKADPTTRIMGTVRDAFLSGALSASGTAIILKNANGTGAAISGLWGNAGMLRIKTGVSPTEYIRFDGWASTSGLRASGVTRGAGGTTARVHSDADRCQLLGWEVPLAVQSVSIGTTFNTEDVFTLGELDSYENVEGIPQIEISVQRIFDGTKPLYLTFTDPDYSSLKGRTSNYKSDLAVSVYPDSQDSATGTPDSTVVCSGVYISAWSASFTADGNFTESVTLVGNDKTWGGQEGVPSGYFLASNSYNSLSMGSGIQRSEQFDKPNSTLPTELDAGDHIQSIDISVDIGREDIPELGRKSPYYRAVTWPVKVTTTIKVITNKGDQVNVLGDADNLTPRSIVIKTKEGLVINLGTQNKLNSVNFEGFNAGGGNGTCTFEYQNSNSLIITHTGFPQAFSVNDDPLCR